MNNYAIDTAARFGDIPFTEFTKELVTGVFDSLVEAHILQMEEYASFVSSLTDDLSTYINNTQDGVSFDQISEFVLNYDLPIVDNDDLVTVLGQLEAPDEAAAPTPANPDATQPATINTWWGGLINALAPAVTGLVDKINDPGEVAGLKALGLVVTEGEIETKITFSTWNNTSRGFNSSNKTKTKVKSKDKRGIFGRIFKGRDKTKSRTVTVNTAKSYQRDSSGTKVDIFGRVLIKFKTDYAPLNG